MTDKARELLGIAIEEWDSDRDLYEFHKVMEEIRAYLAEPEVKREPLSEEEIFNLYNEHEEETSVHSTIFHFNEFARAIEARVLQRKPLKKEQIEKGFQETEYREGESRGRCFVLGVRFAEKHHGIGGDDE